MSNSHARFWANVEQGPFCWEWRGALTGWGYGQLWADKRHWLAHRYSYTIHHGSIPDGLTIDHLCRNIVCVRPDHLEAVTGRVNTLRGTAPAALNARRTHCVNGHELTGDNLQLRKSRAGRICATCNRRRSREYSQRKRGVLGEEAPEYEARIKWDEEATG